MDELDKPIKYVFAHAHKNPTQPFRSNSEAKTSSCIPLSDLKYALTKLILMIDKE